MIVPHSGAVLGGVTEDEARFGVEGEEAVAAADSGQFGEDDVAGCGVGADEEAVVGFGGVGEAELEGGAAGSCVREGMVVVVYGGGG